MPRLTNPDYLQRHRFISQLWEDETLRSFFSHLEPSQQWSLHRYFQTISESSEEEILQKRQQMNAEQKTLPQQAGKAYRELEYVVERTAIALDVSVEPEHLIDCLPELRNVMLERIRRKPDEPKQRQPVQRGEHSVRAVMKPDVDMRQLAKAFIMLAEYLRDQERENGTTR